jgi:hypothetical protein
MVARGAGSGRPRPVDCGEVTLKRRIADVWTLWQNGRSAKKQGYTFNMDRPRSRLPVFRGGKLRRIACLLVIVLIAAVATPVAFSQHAKPFTCAKCGEPITGTYFETNGAYYHSRCFLCAYCGEPVKGTYTTYHDKNYHTDCFENHVAKRCALCDGIIQGQYIMDFWGNAYHLSHQFETQPCDYCGRFIAPHITNGGVRYSDGRYICNVCHKSAVTDKNEAMLILAEVARYMSRFGMKVDLGELDVHVVGLKRMQEKSGKASYRLTGYTDFEENKSLFGLTSKRRIDVYLLYGMPRIDVVSTLAHELAHVWQFTAGRLNNDEAFAEGSCNYASFLVLQNYDGRSSEYLISNLVNDENMIYGEGFRRVKRFAETEGIDAWLDRLENRNRLPKGY